MPCDILAAYERKDVETLAQLKVNICMECGCCSYVCPSNRPLVQTNRLAKPLLASYLKTKQKEAVKK
jgi:electron transport complex protein RnfC